jgi:hypothetical protein
MPIKTRVTGRKGEGIKCIEIGCGAGRIIDPESLKVDTKGENGYCKTIKPSPEEFELMVNAIPNVERLRSGKRQYNPVVYSDKPRLGAGQAN